ncbi:MAG: hypothetical protein M1824_000112 [Vezdaea acicularis]|nr:MAG: hypothetical protein M1824_000112 [Vezdaea acicularis]
MSKVIRSVKNVTKGYTSVQVKVRNATSNDPWGPTGTDMQEIAQMTFNNSSDFFEIMDMLDKRLNDKGKNWRHVLKALKVLDYCLHEGSELVVTWARKNVYVVRTLREFQHIDEDGRDVGQNIRVSAKELTALIQDEERLKGERRDRKSWKSRVTGLDEYAQEPTTPRPKPDRRNRRAEEEEAEVRLAIEASKHEAEEEKRRRQQSQAQPDDDDLQKALKLSKEEEELRRRQLEEQNAAAFFDDDTPTQTTMPQPTGNQGYHQQPAVDWFGNPIDLQQQQQQPQNTGYLNSMYQQPNQFTGQVTGFQPQMTGYQNGFPNGFQQQQQQQPQPTGFDPQTAFNPQANNNFGIPGNPYAGQNQPPSSTDPTPTAGTNNPWAAGHTADALKPAPTGSNNPFASSFGTSNGPAQSFPRPASAQPTLTTLSEQKTQTQFNNHSFNPATSFLPPPQQQNPPPPIQKDNTPQNPHHAQLNALLATGEGQDTFGNVGNTRIPAQHTAPGTFINSAGAGGLDRMTASATGSNPFFNSQQFTGAPGMHPAFGGAAQQGLGGRVMPAQTGPAGVGSGLGFGGSPSPFATQGQQQQQQQQGQYGAQQQQGGNSLIDL